MTVRADPAALLIAGVLAAAASAVPIAAQTAADQDVLVPARQPVFGRWSAAGPDRDQNGAATLPDILRTVPGLRITAAPGNGTGLLAVDHGRAQPGVTVGGIGLPGTLPINLGLPDLAAVAVAAPSGLDFGPVGSAGVLSLTLRRPGSALAGAGEFAAGGFGSRRALAQLDVPLVGGIRLGIGGHLHHDLGWLRSTRTGEMLNRSQRAGVVAALDIDVAADLTLAVDGVYQHNRDGNLPAFACDPLAPATCNGRFASTAIRSSVMPGSGAGWGAISPDLARQPLGQRAELALSSAELAWRPDRFSVSLQAGIARQINRLGLDLRGGSPGSYGLIARGASEHRQLAITAGAVFGAVTINLAAGWQGDDQARDQADTDAGTVLADRAIGQRRDAVYAAAAVQAALADDRLQLNAGLRLNDEKLALTVRDRRAGCAPCLRAAGADRQQRQLLTPDFGLSWQQGDAVIFARSARTARLPGWNLLARTSSELQALPAETGWHHSAGVSYALPSGGLRLDMRGFAANTNALISPLLGIDPIAMALAAGVQQDMTNHGIDVTVAARPVSQLQMSGTFAWQQARWDGPIPAGAPARPLYAPDMTASLSAAWTQTLVGAGANVVPRLTLDYRSAMTVAAAPVPGAPGGIAPAGWQVAAAVQLEIPGGGWLASLECRNCLDRTLVDGAVAGLATLNPPRWWQIRFLRRF
ncbi:hypothetical protein [Sandarakinorhabdus sp.]|uniref:hypothetical protein n=1 Tax=Sandarakinorhabdus sp. TaxID=1916663 RepID=UPI0033421525